MYFYNVLPFPEHRESAKASEGGARKCHVQGTVSLVNIISIRPYLRCIVFDESERSYQMNQRQGTVLLNVPL